jgi:hypothetical protein
MVVGHRRIVALATDAVDARLRENRLLAKEAFPGRATDLIALTSDPSIVAMRFGRSLAMIDPLSRRNDWMRQTRLDGRRTRAPYEDYASAVRRLGSPDRRRVRGSGP